MWRECERRRRHIHSIGRERDDLSYHEPSEIGSTSQSRIPHYVQVREAGEAKGVTQTSTARALDIDEGFPAVSEAKPRVQRQHARQPSLRPREKTVRTRVPRRKCVVG